MPSSRKQQGRGRRQEAVCCSSGISKEASVARLSRLSERIEIKLEKVSLPGHEEEFNC